jgi:hypothetical protein
MQLDHLLFQCTQKGPSERPRRRAAASFLAGGREHGEEFNAPPAAFAPTAVPRRRLADVRNARHQALFQTQRPLPSMMIAT